MTANTISSMAGARNRLNLASAAVVATACFLLFHFVVEDKAAAAHTVIAGQSVADPQNSPASKSISQVRAGASKPKAGTASRTAAGAANNVSQLLASASIPSALKLQSGNQEAANGMTRLDRSIVHDPTEATNELKAAIRSFYQGQYDDARSGLMVYLESPQTAQNPGAADFYLGATMIERSLLRTPQSQWKGPSRDALMAFKQARKENYNPVRAYVSPTLLKIWDSTSQ